MKRQSTKRFIYYQFFILGGFLILTLLNEGLDLPHHFLGDPPTGPIQRWGEMTLEIAFWAVICVIEILFIQKLRRDIKILEGFIPICANCKKIRSFDQWRPVEEYISSHSLVDFSHSICPECRKKLYPELKE